MMPMKLNTIPNNKPKSYHKLMRYVNWLVSSDKVFRCLWFGVMKVKRIMRQIIKQITGYLNKIFRFFSTKLPHLVGVMKTCQSFSKRHKQYKLISWLYFTKYILILTFVVYLIFINVSFSLCYLLSILMARHKNH